MEDSTTNENRQQRVIDLATEALKVSRQVNMDKKWRQMEQRIRADRHRIWMVRLQRVAAMLTIPLLLAVAAQYYIYNKVEDVPVQWLTAHTNPGMTSSVILPDGTKVYLNSETTLKYPQRFDGTLREVSLNGEAYFEVAKDAAKRFIVSTPQQVKVEVTGTQFNMEAYEDCDKVSTTLMEGGVELFYPSDTYTRKVKLIPQQKLVYKASDKTAKLYSTTGETETAWKDGRIIFRNTPFTEALRMLEKRYNVEFIVKSPGLLNYSFTGTFTHQRLERILEYFKVSSRIRWHYVECLDIEYKKSKIELSI
jgi:ferric-dicitrate binding protein FerR (iron transport regulator)